MNFRPRMPRGGQNNSGGFGNESTSGFLSNRGGRGGRGRFQRGAGFRGGFRSEFNRNEAENGNTRPGFRSDFNRNESENSNIRPGFRSDFNRNESDNMRPKGGWKSNVDERSEGKSSGFRGGPENKPSGFRGGGQFGGLKDKRDMNMSQEANNFKPKDTTASVQPLGGINNTGSLSSVNTNANKWQQDASQVSKTVAPAPSTAAKNAQRTNDVEIIVTHKILTEYAEFIERRLKSEGFNVDLLFPNEEVPLGRVLGNISSRGTLYALVVTQLSEERRSVTVNILHGQTQEHRNMALDDAIFLIKGNFESFKKGEPVSVVPGPGAVPISPSGIPLGEKHPEAIQYLLDILVRNRPLDPVQYEKLIFYLQDKRDKVLRNDPAHNISINRPGETGFQGDVDKAQIQNRVLDLLSKKFSKPAHSANSPSSLAADPKIANAVKNVLQNKFLIRN